MSLIYNGQVKFGANFNMNISAPLDTRTVVSSLNDVQIANNDLFTDKVYNGMTIVCQDTFDMFVLTNIGDAKTIVIGEKEYTGKALTWRQVGKETDLSNCVTVDQLNDVLSYYVTYSDVEDIVDVIDGEIESLRGVAYVMGEDIEGLKTFTSYNYDKIEELQNISYALALEVTDAKDIAGAAQSAAEAAQDAAEGAAQKAAEAAQDAAEAAQAAGQVTEAIRIAGEAKTAAEGAQGAAEAAAGSAEAAQGAAEAAKSAAEQAVGTAGDALERANDAYDYAGSAYTIGVNALTEASNARAASYAFTEQAYSRANAAYDYAGNAYSRANEAYDYADTVHNTAISYNTYVLSYIETSNAYIHSIATGAHDYAGQAYSRANQAHDYAGQAYSRANEAYTFAGSTYSYVLNYIGTSNREANAYIENALSRANAAYSRANVAYNYAESSYSYVLSYIGTSYANAVKSALTAEKYSYAYTSNLVNSLKANELTEIANTAQTAYNIAYTIAYTEGIDDAIDTIKDIAYWINENPAGAVGMLESITELGETTSQILDRVGYLESLDLNDEKLWRENQTGQPLFSYHYFENGVSGKAYVMSLKEYDDYMRYSTKLTWSTI